ncbi:hypothetical protein R70331_31030 [Paenibacillus sp. FSL R7-0331]|nr:hypothetical protein R70331_31030 [Paenibacillus sp. FSL R7-0331]
MPTIEIRTGSTTNEASIVHTMQRETSEGELAKRSAGATELTATDMDARMSSTENKGPVIFQ